jgi:hypothetical protein
MALVVVLLLMVAHISSIGAGVFSRVHDGGVATVDTDGDGDGSYCADIGAPGAGDTCGGTDDGSLVAVLELMLLMLLLELVLWC